MLRSFVVAGLALAVVSTAHAAPMTLSHQGRLLDASDQPLTGVHTVVFRLFDVPAGGTALWSESHNLDLGTEGIYDVILGRTTSLATLGFDVTYYLEIEVDGEVLVPRTELTSVPYSLSTEIRPNTVDEGALTFDPATQGELDALAAALAALQAQVDALEATKLPQILGRTTGTSTGSFSFQGATGTQAASAMCQDTFADADAHMCTLSEVQLAISMNRVNTIADYTGQACWALSTTPRLHGQDVTWNAAAKSYLADCHNLLYVSGHFSTGTTVTVLDNYTSDGNQGTGMAYRVEANAACGTPRPVLCCR